MWDDFVKSFADRALAESPDPGPPLNPRESGFESPEGMDGHHCRRSLLPGGRNVKRAREALLPSV